ncbi:MAG: replication initiator protein WhiP [Desulfurococcales archaeon]|nr:replication initiator protein WhiP [Desulfurococcales archaeon]
MNDYRNLLEYIAEEVAKSTKTRGGPRSKIIEAALVLLLSKPMRAAEIAQVVGVETKYVSSYLSYWRTRGYLEYSNGLWYLTPKGEDYAKSIVERTLATRFSEYVAIAKQLLGENKHQTKNHKKKPLRSQETSELLSFIVNQTKQSDNKPQKIRVQLGNIDPQCVFNILKQRLNEEELEVLQILVDNLANWGSSYMYLDQIQEKLHAELPFILKVTRDLQTKQIVYIYNDRRLGIRVGFTRRVKAYIEDMCRKENSTIA